MTTTAKALTQQQGQQAPPPISERTGGYACGQCGFATSKPDHYIIIPTRLLPETTRRAIYGEGKPDANTLLCCECDTRARQQGEEKHEEKGGQL
jgi:hypothetical protein